MQLDHGGGYVFEKIDGGSVIWDIVEFSTFTFLGGRWRWAGCVAC
jgi:hypothetical protein